jgi:hypothetical protein
MVAITMLHPDEICLR